MDGWIIEQDMVFVICQYVAKSRINPGLDKFSAIEPGQTDQ